ncbi:DUF4280 domain-containing protein [Pelosinus sp. IPA-1]|uniref:DUF4280 domain-containing protein n=1 Tax=Pelosinus sp. IPA-1 TaxID=3029569 RepID=UPI002436214B|nr:DUF4280 domain-containing protein [Pelosinus sp. IPA-1]GMA99901.1 hypothetical protein PIPA1_27010 [Pelosinus sp. IPA-1]
MDTKYVVRGAKVKCSNGGTTCNLNLPKSHGMYVNDKAVLNDHDCVPYSNVLPFGKCDKIKKACVLALAPKWEDAKDTTILKGHPALLAKSVLSCTIGGAITILNDGQKG